MLECISCKNQFKPSKEALHIAIEYAGLLAPSVLHDAIDCPECGRQNILGERLPRLRINEDASDKEGLIAAARNVTETITNEEDEEEPGKTNIGDCQTCWCNTCTYLEKCYIRRREHGNLESNGGKPWPCFECYDGERFMPLEKERRCSGYEEGEENYG